MNATVAERGQVTIPKRLRDRLGIGPKAVVNFEEEGGRLVLTKVVEGDPVSRVLGCVRLGMKTDEFVRDLRGDA